MYYLTPRKTENGNYGNPHSERIDGDLLLPVELLPAYIETMGFAILTFENGVVTSVSRNEADYEAYIADHPIVPDDETEPETDGDILDALLGVE